MRKIVLSYLLVLCSLVAVAQTPVRVACVGNSITYGAGIENRERDAYPAQLQRMLGEGYVVGNFGKSGATLLNKGHRPYIGQKEFQRALTFAGDVVVIHLGINDTDPRDWPNYRDYFVRDYLALIDSFRVVNPKVRILVARMTPITNRHSRFESGTRDWHEQIQHAIERVAELAGAQLIDFHTPLYPYPFMLPDAVHPTAEGAGILAQTVCSAITGDYGGLRLPQVYSDNMVLQRDCPLEVRGTANAGEEVTISIAGQKQRAKTGSDGQWCVRLKPMQAGGPHTLTVSAGKTRLHFSNVLVGEVWLCSGQSNMEFMLKEASTARMDIPQSGNNNIRLLDMKARWRTNPVEWEVSVLDSLNHLQYYKDSQWTVCTSVSAADFSAVAYYFGKMLQDSLHVPVGLICNAIGGSPTEAWVSRHALEFHLPVMFRNWTKNDPQNWIRARATLNVKKSTNKFQRHPYEPCYLYESGILPLDKFPVKGVIWYQGESNAPDYETHEKLFHLLVDSWRKNWENPELPFYYVQLSSMDRPSWPWFRDSQRRLLKEIPYTGMAVSSDQGDSLDVHPKNKKPVGERLARQALNRTYGMKAVVPSGPLFRSAEFRKGAAYVSFDFADGMSSSDGKALRTFEVAETEGLFYPAKAEIVGDQIKVYSNQVKHPRYVRYGWQPFTRANLVNAQGLPASTFRSY
ncbi:sialate O-acetylesterase [Bacteroides sp. K03]|uniref:GDSL-type esterase/lipase family protein n=1 Tax=Bacteroides sp. K03 TaxID=2718928 RepID=UPI001C8C485A|nr:GDSL-type esterase/lipase family protein [Bacteroides sp. K03]MBX9187380.1 sialate O-acetylesterase [Bacteroides sp. K03]